MANVLDNEVILESGQGVVVWRDMATDTDLLRVSYSATDPNGVLTAPLGSLVSGASGMWENIDGATTWALVLTSLEGAFLAPNEYYVDQTAVANPATRVYPTVVAAITGAEAEQTGPYMLRLRMGQAHVWAMGGEIPAASTRDVTIYGDTQSTVLSLSGTLAAAGAGATLRFQNVSVSVTGSLKTGSGRRVVLDGVFWDGGDFEFRVIGPGLLVTDSTFGSSQVTGFTDSGLATAAFTRCSVSFSSTQPVPFINGAAEIVFDGCSVDGRHSGNATYFSNGANAIVGSISGSTFELRQDAGSAIVFTSVAGTDISFSNSFFSWVDPGAGSVNFSALSVTSTPAGICSTGRTLGVDLFNLPSGAWYTNGGAVSVVP